MDRLDADRMFVAVVETGSFARAAERIGTSSGQASKLVAKLEADLGVRLLHRTTRALSTTDVGRAYFEGVRDILSEFKALDASVRNASGVAAGRIRVSVPLSFGVTTLAPLLLEFARLYPEIQLDVGFTDRAVSLVEEGYDLAVRVGMPEDSSLIGRRLCDMRVAICGAPDYLAEHGAPRVPADLTRHACLIDTNMRESFLWRFRSPEGLAISVPVSGRLRFSNTEACLRGAEVGLGLAAVPLFLSAAALREGRVVRLLQDYEDHTRGVHVLYPAGRHLALKVRVLVDFLAREFRGTVPWDREAERTAENSVQIGRKESTEVPLMSEVEGDHTPEA